MRPVPCPCPCSDPACECDPDFDPACECDPDFDPACESGVKCLKFGKPGDGALFRDPDFKSTLLTYAWMGADYRGGIPAHAL